MIAVDDVKNHIANILNKIDSDHDLARDLYFDYKKSGDELLATLYFEKMCAYEGTRCWVMGYARDNGISR